MHEAITKNPCGLGYASLGSQPASVRALCIGDKGRCAKPEAMSVLSGQYPLRRNLYVYSRQDASTPVKNFLQWIGSDEAICSVMGKTAVLPSRILVCR